jgi:ATP-dependent Clp protease ATP-binding subunit ClpC
MDNLRKTFNPEFLNRLDDAIVFHQLTRENMSEIVEILLGNFTKRLNILEMAVDFAPEAKEFLVEKGFDPALGARPLKRAIQRYLEDPLSEMLLQSGMKREGEVAVGVGEVGLTFDRVADKETEDE